MKEARGNIKRALLSVYEKSGVVDLATALQGHGVELLASGKTTTHQCTRERG